MGREKVKTKGVVTGTREIETDPGVADKRLLAYESELAGVLKQIERQGNILSITLRQAWEAGELGSLTKNSPAKATGAHISVIGHCTAEELRRYLTTTEVANGLGNRFLWFCVKRSKCLPDGGNPDQEELGRLGRDLAAALQFGRKLGEMRRDDNARKAWHEVYEPLSEGKPGLAGHLLARGEAHVMRLACLYAVLDQSAVVQATHLLAALALWDSCERSVRYIFGDSLGDEVADDILRHLRGAAPYGLSRTEISALLGRNLPRSRIAQALALLQQQRLASPESVKPEGGRGRPEERWFASR
jgi:hypothetical protein